MRWLVMLFALMPLGCVHIARATGVAGWFTVDERPDLAYGERFAPISLEPGEDCGALKQRLRSDSLVVALVHGVKGDGTEMLVPLQELPALPKHELLMYRWVPWHDRDAIITGLAAGVNELTRCLAAEKPKVVLVCHSAGGVACAWAAHLITPPDGVTVYVLTVASPLAGSVVRTRRENDREEATFMLDLGSDIRGYPEAAPGVVVLHLRTNAKSDPVMAPGGDGHQPNDPKVGVANAEQLDLPDWLSHDASLTYVIHKLVQAQGDPKAASW